MEKGYIFPITLMLTLLVSAFLLHQIELYKMEQLFYAETEELFELESMMKYTWDHVEKELQTETLPSNSSLSFPTGSATIIIQDRGQNIEIKIVCLTKQGRRYEATIQYDPTAQQVVNWTEIH